MKIIKAKTNKHTNPKKPANGKILGVAVVAFKSFEFNAPTVDSFNYSWFVDENVYLKDYHDIFFKLDVDANARKVARSHTHIHTPSQTHTQPLTLTHRQNTEFLV